MKTDTHPKYFPKAQVQCVCGNTFTVGSTKEHINVELCYNCHPFYTGKEKLIDTAGKVEKFRARKKVAEATPIKKAKTRVKKPSSKKKVK